MVGPLRPSHILRTGFTHPTAATVLVQGLQPEPKHFGSIEDDWTSKKRTFRRTRGWKSSAPMYLYPSYFSYPLYSNLFGNHPALKLFAIRYKFFYNFTIKLNASLVWTLSCLFEIYEIWFFNNSFYFSVKISSCLKTKKGREMRIPPPLPLTELSMFHIFARHKK